MTELSALNIKITGDAGDLKAAVAAANGDLAKLVAGAEAAGLKVSGLGNKFSKVGGAATSSGLAMRGVAQQLSQVGQQTMATGNFVQALAIQLPDIGIGFGALGGAIGLVAGIALPMLISAFGSSISAAAETAKTLEELGTKTEAYAATANAAAMPVAELASKYGMLATEARAALQAMSDVALIEAMNATDAAITSIVESITRIETFGATRIMAEDFGLAADQAELLVWNLLQLDRANGLTAQAAAAAKVSDQLLAAYGSVDKMPAPLRIVYDQLAKITIAAASTATTIDKLPELLALASAAASGAASAVAGIGTAASGAYAAVASLVGKMQGMAGAYGKAQNAELASQYAQYGAGRVAGERLARESGSLYGGDGTVNIGDGGGGGGGGGNPMLAELESVQASLMSQEALQLESYTRQQEQLALFLEQKLITQQEYAAMSEASQQQHSDAMSAIDVYRYGTGLQKAGAFFGDMASALAGGNEKMMKISKAFGAAEALINAWRAYAQALATPGINPLQKFALAAKVLAAGMGAVNAIRGGGGGGGGKSSAAGGAGAGAASPTQTLNFTVTNDPFGFGERIVRQIATQLNESRRNGSNIIASVR